MTLATDAEEAWEWAKKLPSQYAPPDGLLRIIGFAQRGVQLHTYIRSGDELSAADQCAYVYEILGEFGMVVP